MQNILREANAEYKGENQAVNIWEVIKKRAFDMLLIKRDKSTKEGGEYE